MNASPSAQATFSCWASYVLGHAAADQRGDAGRGLAAQRPGRQPALDRPAAGVHDLRPQVHQLQDVAGDVVGDVAGRVAVPEHRIEPDRVQVDHLAGVPGVAQSLGEVFQHAVAERPRVLVRVDGQHLHLALPSAAGLRFRVRVGSFLAPGSVTWWRRSWPGRFWLAGLQQLQDLVGVLADGGDVAEHPLRPGVIRHRLEPFLPVDVAHLRAEAPGQYAQHGEQRGDGKYLLHAPIVIRPGRAPAGRKVPRAGGPTALFRPRRRAHAVSELAVITGMPGTAGRTGREERDAPPEKRHHRHRPGGCRRPVVPAVGHRLRAARV